MKWAVLHDAGARFDRDLEQLTAETIAEDHLLERTPVPRALRRRLLPALATLREDDRLAEQLLGELRKGDRGAAAGIGQELAAAPDTSWALDHAGLPDCGSRQRQALG